MASEELTREAQDPATSAARLQELAQLDRGLWVAIASHPHAYPGLLDWLGEHGDDEVAAAIAARSAAPAAPAAPSAPPAPPTAEAQAAAPAAASDAEPTLVNEPVTPQPVTPQPVTPQPVTPEPEPAAATGTEPATSSANGLKLLAIIAAVVVLCGGGWFAANALSGDDDGDDVVLPTTSAPTPSPSADAPSDAPTTASPAPTTRPGVGGDFCALMKEVQDIGTSALSGSSGSDPSKTLEDTKAQLQRLSDTYKQLAATAPDEIKADTQTLSDFLEATTDFTTSGGRKKLPDTKGYVEASQNIAAYYYKNCV